MAKAKRSTRSSTRPGRSAPAAGRKTSRTPSAASAGRPPRGPAAPRSPGTRGSGDRRTAGPPAAARRPRAATGGATAPVARVVERAPTPALPETDQLGAARGRYVYCIIRSTEPLKFGPIGMDEQWPDVYTIIYQDMAAIVSDVPISPLDSTRENVLAHERVNETVMREHTVIPMSFGTIFKTREDIMELLRSAYEAFTDVLNKMQDKLEFGLKVLWDRDETVRAIEEEDEDIHRLKSEISSQKGSTYFARMQYGRLIDSALQQRSDRHVTEFLQRLRDVSVASRVNRAIGDKMIMNAAFLVQRDQELAFDRRIKEIAAAFDKLTFKYTGPGPPYNFVNIRLKLERAGQH
jgi:hypothetical protein